MHNVHENCATARWAEGYLARVNLDFAIAAFNNLYMFLRCDCDS